MHSHSIDPLKGLNLKSLDPNKTAGGENKLEKIDKEIEEIRKDTAEIERETQIIRAQGTTQETPTAKSALMRRLNIL